MNKTIVILVVIVVVIAGGYFLLNGNVQAPVQNNTQNSMQKQDETSQLNVDDTNQMTGKYIVNFTDSGYSPSELKIKVGDTVTFVNNSSNTVWTASAMHPSHIIYSGTSLQQHCPDAENSAFDECKSSQPGESWSFTFNKQGTWGYHNHMATKDFGKII